MDKETRDTLERIEMALLRVEHRQNVGLQIAQITREISSSQSEVLQITKILYMSNGIYIEVR